MDASMSTFNCSTAIHANNSVMSGIAKSYVIPAPRARFSHVNYRLRIIMLTAMDTPRNA